MAAYRGWIGARSIPTTSAWGNSSAMSIALLEHETDSARNLKYILPLSCSGAEVEDLVNYSRNELI